MTANAKLREAIIVALSQPMSKRVSAVEALFQAHQQELLRELLGELPERELPQVEPGALIIEHEGKLVKTDHLAKMRNTGFNQAIDQVVSVIQSKIGELNG